MTIKLFSQFCVCFLKPPPKESGGEEGQTKTVLRRRRRGIRQRRIKDSWKSKCDESEFEGLLQYSDTEAWDSDLDDLDIQFVFKDPVEGRWGYKIVPLKQYEENIRTKTRKAVVSQMVSEMFDSIIEYQSNREWFTVYDDDVGNDSTRSYGMYEVVDLDYVDLNSADLVSELRKGGVAAALAAADAEMARQMSDEGGDSAYEPGWRGETSQVQTSQDRKQRPKVEQMWSGDFQAEDTGSVKGGSPRSEVPSLDPQRFRRLYNFDDDDNQTEISSLSVNSTQESTNIARFTQTTPQIEDMKAQEEVELKLGEEAVKDENDSDNDSQAEYTSITKDVALEQTSEEEEEVLEEERELQNENSQQVRDDAAAEQNQGGYLRLAESSSGIDTSSEEDNIGVEQSQVEEEGAQNPELAATCSQSISEDVGAQLPTSTLGNVYQASLKDSEDTKINLVLLETSSSSEEENNLKVALQY